MHQFKRWSGKVFLLHMHFIIFPPESQWIWIIAMDQKTPEGSLPHAALTQLLNKFPTYKLQLQEEAVTVIRDIETILSCVAISEDIDGDVPAK